MNNESDKRRRGAMASLSETRARVGAAIRVSDVDFIEYTSSRSGKLDPVVRFGLPSGRYRLTSNSPQGVGELNEFYNSFVAGSFEKPIWKLPESVSVEPE